MVDATEGVLGIEWIDGNSVRFLLGGGAEDEEEIAEDGDVPESEADEVEDEDHLKEYNVSAGIVGSDRTRRGLTKSTLPDVVMQMIGTEIAKMHQADIIHGDLTTSNMMLRHPSSPRGLQLVRFRVPLPWQNPANGAHTGADRLRASVHVHPCRGQGR